MLRGAALLSLLACACAADDATPKKACTSSLKGDYPFEACGAFCKQAKSGNHCKFCKCKACTFCGASASTTTSAPPALSPSLRRSAPPPPRWPKKMMKKGRGGNSSAKTGGAKPKKTKCESGLKGDLPFITCGSFCKAAKAGNHCKFCKCRSCAYCTADGKQNEAYVPPVTPAAAGHSFGTTEPPPKSAPGGASIDAAAVSSGPALGPPQRGVPVDTAAKTGGSHMVLIQGLGIAVLVVLLGLGLAAFTSQGDATMGSWRHTLQTHLAKMGLADYGREGTRLNTERDDEPEGSSSNLDEAFRAVDKLEADMGATR